MSPTKLIGAILVVAGILGLIYGGFSYTKSTHEATVGPLDFSVKSTEHVNVPIWAGVLALAVGGTLLVAGRRS